MRKTIFGLLGAKIIILSNNHTIRATHYTYNLGISFKKPREKSSYYESIILLDLPAYPPAGTICSFSIFKQTLTGKFQADLA